MKKNSQIAWVVEQIEKNGEVTRNECLNRFPAITRLSAIIQNLETRGFRFKPDYRGSDFVYSLQDKPKPPPRKVFTVRDPLSGNLIEVV